MFKYALVAVFALTTSVCVANSQSPSDSSEKYTSVRNLPVIILSEVIAEGKCRLHFENGTTLDISCDTTNKEIPQGQAVAAK